MPITRVMACDAVDFLLSTALIYVCYISSGVIHEKMYLPLTQAQTLLPQHLYQHLVNIL